VRRKQDRDSRSEVSSLSRGVERTTLKETIESRLREAIVSGEIAPSARIREAALAENLGVSRAPVREALRSLEQDGLVVSSGGYQGYFVRTADIEELRELFQLRMALERLSVGLALDHVTPHDLAHLAGIIQQMDVAAESRPQDMADLDARFHEYICRMAQHKLLLRIWSSMRDQIRVALAAVNVLHEHSPDFAESHRVVLRGLESNDRQHVQTLMEEHILFGMDRYVGKASVARDAGRAGNM
jgi:DNA-binding GntR family transcriptional regulator